MLWSGDNLKKRGSLPIETADLLRRIAHKTRIQTCWNLRTVIHLSAQNTMHNMATVQEQSHQYVEFL
jgi:hypothetical protein